MIPDRFFALTESPDADPLTIELVTRGYAIARAAAPLCLITEISADLDQRFARTPFCVGPFHGSSTKRFHQLLARSERSAELVLSGRVLDTVTKVLGPWCDFPELNLSQGVEIHPGAPPQIPHCDQAMWPAVPKGQMELCVNVFWPMTRFTPENGATRIWEGSHAQPRVAGEPLPDPVVAEITPGDALLILGSTVHAAGANVTNTPRRAAIVSYCLGWLKAYENQSLAYPPGIARRFRPELADLVGYRWHRPNLGTYDGQCPSILLDDQIPEHLATVDALSPEHERLVADYETRVKAAA